MMTNYFSFEEYSDFTKITSIYLFSLPFIYIASVGRIWIVASKSEIYAMKRAFLAISINFFKYFLYKFLGVKGVAFSTSLNFLFCYWILDFFVYKQRVQFFAKFSIITNIGEYIELRCVFRRWKNLLGSHKWSEVYEQI